MKPAYAPFALLGAGLWWGLYALTRVIVEFLRGMGPLGELVGSHLLGLVMLCVLGFLGLSAFVSALSSLYLSRDLPMLLARPVPLPAVHASKSVVAGIGAAWMPVAFIPAVLAGYGAAYGAGWAYYAAIVPASVAYALAPVGVGVLCSHLATWLMPARGSRAGALGLGLVLFVGAYFVFQHSTAPARDSLEALFTALLRIRADSPMLPSYWFTRSMGALMRGGAVDALYAALLATNALFWPTVALLAGDALYARNIQKTAGVGAPSRAGGRAGLFGPGHAFMAKDAIIFMRDPEQWTQLGVVGSLLVIYVYNFRLMPVATLLGMSPYASWLLAAGNAALAGLVLVALGARFLYVAVSLEAGAFWAVRSAPVRLSHMLREKLVVGAVPLGALALGLALAGGWLMGQGAAEVAATVAVVGVMSVAVCSLALGMGALMPRFQHESIAQVSTSMGSVAFMGAAFLLVALTLALALAGGWLWAGGSHALGLGVWALGLGLNAWAGIIPLRAGAASLERAQ
jgi:ABC-2 type transport system permease protein